MSTVEERLARLEQRVFGEAPVVAPERPVERPVEPPLVTPVVVLPTTGGRAGAIGPSTGTGRPGTAPSTPAFDPADPYSPHLGMTSGNPKWFDAPGAGYTKDFYIGPVPPGWRGTLEVSVGGERGGAKISAMDAVLRAGVIALAADPKAVQPKIYYQVKADIAGLLTLTVTTYSEGLGYVELHPHQDIWL